MNNIKNFFVFSVAVIFTSIGEASIDNGQSIDQIDNIKKVIERARSELIQSSKVDQIEIDRSFDKMNEAVFSLKIHLGFVEFNRKGGGPISYKPQDYAISYFYTALLTGYVNFYNYSLQWYEEGVFDSEKFHKLNLELLSAIHGLNLFFFEYTDFHRLYLLDFDQLYDRTANFNESFAKLEKFVEENKILSKEMEVFQFWLQLLSENQNKLQVFKELEEDEKIRLETVSIIMFFYKFFYDMPKYISDISVNSENLAGVRPIVEILDDFGTEYPLPFSEEITFSY